MSAIRQRLVVMLCCGLCAGCGGNGTTTPAGPALSIARLALAAGQDSGTFNFNPGGADVTWTVTASEPWLTVTPASGTGNAAITVTVDRAGLLAGTLAASLRFETRLGNPLLPVTVVVPSEGGAVLQVTPATLDFGAGSNTATFQIANSGSGDLAWSAAELVSWATVSPRTGSGGGTVTVTVNRAGLAAGTHQGFVRVSSSGGTATVALSLVVAGAGAGQQVLAFSPAALAFGSENEQTLALLAGNGVTWAIQPSAPWLSVTPMSGIGAADLTVRLNRSQLAAGLNSAVLAVTYTAGGQTVHTGLVVTVFVGTSGPQAQLAVSPAALSFGDQAATRTLTVANLGPGSLTWTVASSAPWVAVSPTSGSGNGSVQVAFDPDHPAISEAATITFSSSGGTVSVPVSVLLNGGGQGSLLPALDVAPAFLDFGVVGTERELQVRNIGGGVLPWSASSLQNWISIFPASGVDDTVVRVVVDRAVLPGDNNLGSITFTSDFGTRTVLVSASRESGQGNPQLLLNPTGLDFGSAATQRTFAVANAGGGTLTWTATPSQPWITVSPPAASGGATVTVTVDRSGLAPGTHVGAVAVTSNGGNASVVIAATVP
ncbi:MAG: BACON domain-containing protein [Armatimonadetes bacterium]|nr:BACON domain-containing protein [Armatimonadota bacterium]